MSWFRTMRRADHTHGATPRAAAGTFSSTVSTAALLAGLTVASLTAGQTQAIADTSGTGRTTIAVTRAPSQVWVQMGDATGDYFCGGVILDASHIITAAHCTRNNTGATFTAAQISVTAGISAFDPITWLATPLTGDVEQDAHVATLRGHPGYVWTAAPATAAAEADDVAVLALTAPLTLTGPTASSVAPVAAGHRPPPGTSVAATGFGAAAPGSSVGDGHLHSVSQTVEDSAITTDGSNAVWLVSTGSGGVCQGDSGGPVLAGSPAVLVGIISHAASCDAGTDSFATDVSSPEIRSFLLGDDHPASAPRGGSGADETASAYVQPGATLNCAAGTWTNAPTLSFRFINQADGQVLQDGASASYVTQAGDVGHTVGCRVTATNSGGAGQAVASHAYVVNPTAPPPAPVAPPAPPVAAKSVDLALGLLHQQPRVRRSKRTNFALSVSNRSGAARSAIAACIVVPTGVRIAAPRGARLLSARSACWTVANLPPGKITFLAFRLSFVGSGGRGHRSPRLPRIPA